MQRKDAKITKRKVYCPNSSRLGFAKWEASPGDVITFNHGKNDEVPCPSPCIARVVGRVDASGTDGDPVKGWICAIMLGSTGTFAYEVWVDPAWVLSIEPACPGFFGAWAGGDVDRLLEQSRYGSLSASLMDYADTRVKPRTQCVECGHTEPLKIPTEETDG